MDNKELAQYRLKHYELIVENFEKALDIARPVITRFDGKTFTKRLVNQLNEVVNRFDNLMSIVKDPYNNATTAFKAYIYPRMYELPSGEMLYAQGTENAESIIFYTDENNKFIADKTLVLLEDRLECRKNYIEKARAEIENYDALAAKKEDLIKQVREFNRNLTSFNDCLRIDRKDVW